MSNPGAFNPLTNDRAAHATALSSAAAPTSQNGVVADPATARTAQLIDASVYRRFTASSAVTYTIPANAVTPFPINSIIEFEQAGTGAVTVAGGAIPGGGNVTIQSRASDYTLAGQYSPAAIRKVDTDTWVLTGDL